jgi:hypothetical protein
MIAHVYRLVAEFNHTKGLTAEEREEMIRRVDQIIRWSSWPTEVKIEYVDYQPVTR